MAPEIKDDRVALLRIIAGFCPLAFGCFLAVLLQRMDSLVADGLMSDLSIGEGTLWILSAAFPLAFAACLIPSAIAIDRFGPRTVQSVMMGVTALGALMFSLSTGPFGLAIGYTLLGAGTASALLAAIKAAVMWLPRDHLGLATGGLVAVAGLGALAAADPAALLVRAYGWGTLLILLAALAVICAILTALLLPAPATVTGDGPDQDPNQDPNQDLGLPFILRDPLFRRLAPLAAVVVGTVWAIQGQWVANWLVAVQGHKLTAIVSYISLIAVGQSAGALLWGWLVDWAVRMGLSAASVFVGAVALCLCIQLAAVGGIALPTSIVWGALLAGAAAMLPFVVLLRHLPQGYAARACASVSLLQYVATLLIQSAIGVVVAIWPHDASGQASATAYAMAFRVPIALQLAALAWFLFPRSEPRDRAESAGEIAVGFASLRAAAQSLVNNLQTLLHNLQTLLTQRRGAAPAQHQRQDLPEPPSMPARLPVDEAAAPADDAAVEPADTTGATAETVAAPTDAAVEPTDIASAPTEAPTETATETEVAASAPAETVEVAADTAASASLAVEPADTPGATAETVAAPIDAALEPTDTASAPTETATETEVAASAPGKTTLPPAETALRSIIDAALSLGLGGAADTTRRASAGTSNRAAPAPAAEIAQPPIAQPAEGRLSFPLIAPSHVQALNAVYRRRPPLAATIGGRQASIIAAWPPPDRRADASHRLSLRLDGEPCELWLPQSLLDVLVESVDPALSLDRLGPDRAAIILEYALDSVLAAVEINLGCKLAVESFAPRLEPRQSDPQLPLFFTVVIEGLGTTGCELRIAPDDALALAEGLDRHAGISRSFLDLPFPVCLRVAAANLAAGEIERLSPDDVVLVEASCQGGHAAIAVIGERLVAPVALAPEGHRLAAHPIAGATSPWAWSMPTDATAAAWQTNAETDNRSLPLHVLFEIGRFEMPASKVKLLAPNAPLPLPPPHDHTVDIVVAGQPIGRGTLMQIGNRTGVRINALRQRPRRPPPAMQPPAQDR